MKYLVLVLLTGCWQTTLYIGPRVDSTGEVGVELGATLGAAHSAGDRRAMSLSVESSLRLDTLGTEGCVDCATVVSRGSPAPIEKPSRGTIRGVLEWHEHPATDNRFKLAPGIGWRAGVYAGAEIRGVPHQPGESIGLVGAMVAVDPWVWGLDDHRNTQYIGIGLQFGAEALADGRYAGRAAIAIDLQYLPTF